MGIPEVADYFALKRSWLYDHWRAQGIPFRKLGGQLRIRRSELDEWYEIQPAA
ncbi:helix-turn-helix domain-containing protein [Actinocorallia sp. A-T 12471]|uniref:helix-turn-helix domain-containing protein n=1 Tax=Actinocorallia sp. A-T 12471 TaxID=3089813 RepID=UPI0029CC5350|nr:helix-turn-helix domain-containing protein [Actinocorallia sp. A-T 12471]MDX6738612.1 helix-turn-helix domain-containing protein [Actinocorallia sp. A-T 12471]